MPSQNPFIDAQVNLYDAMDARRRAQMDLERAKFQESIAARTSIPNAIAIAQQNRAKAEKAKQNAQTASGKAAADAQMAAQNPSFLPPMTPVTGQPATGTTQALAGAGADILRTITGGAGLKQANIPGANAGNAGMGQGINPAAPATPMATGLVAGGSALGPAGAAASAMFAGSPILAGAGGSTPGAAPSSITMSPTNIPGVAQASQTLTPGDRWAAAAAGLLDVVARRGQAITDFQEMISGKRNLGAVNIPTATDLAKPHIQSLAELEMLRQRVAANPNADPKMVAAIEDRFNEQIQGLRANAERAGADPNEAQAEAINGMSGLVLQAQRKAEERQGDAEAAQQRRFDLADYNEQIRQREAKFESNLAEGRAKRVAEFTSNLAEQRTIRAEDRAKLLPPAVLAQRQLDTTTKYATEGPQAVPKEQRIYLPPNIQAALAKDELPVITPAMQNDIQKSIQAARKNQNNASELENAWMPEYFTWKATRDYWALKAQSKLGFDITPEEDAFVKRYSRMDEVYGQMRSDRIRSEAGAQISETEWQLMAPTLPDPSDSKEIADAKLKQFKEYWGLLALRQEVTLRSGFGADIGKILHPLGVAQGGGVVLNFSDMRKLAGGFAEQAMNDQIAKGVDRFTAQEQVKEVLRSRFGLDPDKYLGAEPAPALR